MKYRAIIFDMDGTIIDTDLVWKTATRQLMMKYCPTITEDLMHEVEEKLIGMGLHQSCQIIKDSCGIDQPLEELVYEKKAIAALLMEHGIKFIDGFQDFHERMTQHELISGVATNADDTTVDITKRTLKLERFFGEHIYSVSHVNFQYKPEPTIYLHAAGKLGIEPAQCIAIEDSKPGIQAAKRAGMFCIGINTIKNRDYLKEADMIIDSYNDLDIQDIIY